MERQRLYNEKVVAQPGQVRGANVAEPPAGHDWADNLLKTVAGAGSDIMRVIAHDYVRNENSLMQEALISADTKFESWKQDYMKEHQGQSALDAQRDFVRKYGEIRQETMDMFQGHDNEVFRQRLDQSLGLRALHALQTGGAYQEQQDAAWQKSVFDGVLANYRKDVQANPGNEQYLAARRAETIQDMQTRFKGDDLTARIAELDEQTAEDRMNALLAAGSAGDTAALDEAKRLLGTGGQGGGNLGDGVARWESGREGIQAIGYDPNGGTSYGKWQLSSKQGSYGEWLDHLEKTGEKGAAIAKELRAAGASNTGGKKGAAVDTYKRLAAENPELFEQSQREYLTRTHYNRALAKLPASARAMIESDGALQDMVFSTAVQHGGGGAAKILNGAWKEGMGKADLVRAVYAGRTNPGNFASTPSGMAQNITGGRFPEERDYILSRLDGKGGTPAGTSGTTSLPSLSPEKAMAYWHKIEMMEKHNLEQAKKAQEATLAQNIQGVVTSLGDLDPDQRKAAVYAQLDKITDPEQRKNAISIANREIEFQDKKQKAQRAFAVSSLVQQARQPNVSPAQQEEMVLKSGLNEEDQKDALKRIRGEVKTNELNMRATAAMRRQIDEARQNGQPMDDDSIFRFYRDNMLTQAQLEELIKYRDEGGKGGHVTQSQVNNIWRDLQGEMGEKKKADDAPAELYGAVLKLLPDGRKATYDDIRKAVSQAIVKGRVSGFIWDSSYTRAEAMAKGKIDKWRSEEESKNEYVY